MNIKILYLSIVSLFLTSLCWGQVPASEKAALQAFYIATGGDNWTNTTNGQGVWDFNTPVTAWDSVNQTGWYGIKLENSSVSEIYLFQNELTGTLPASLNNLLNLKVLSISRNNLGGQIPIELGGLENLIFLNLSHNNFTGGIPLELGQLSNLDHLYLSNNPLGGQIPNEIGNLSSLQVLELSYCQLVGSLPSQFGSIN